MESSQWIVWIYLVLLGMLVLGVLSILGMALLTEPREHKRPTATRHKRNWGTLLSKFFDNQALGTVIGYGGDALHRIDQRGESEVEPIELRVPKAPVADSTLDDDSFDLWSLFDF